MNHGDRLGKKSSMELATKSKPAQIVNPQHQQLGSCLISISSSRYRNCQKRKLKNRDHNSVMEKLISTHIVNRDVSRSLVVVFSNAIAMLDYDKPWKEGCSSVPYRHALVMLSKFDLEIRLIYCLVMNIQFLESYHLVPHHQTHSYPPYQLGPWHQ